MRQRDKNKDATGQRVALATPRINVVPTTPKNVSSRSSLQAAIRRSAERQLNAAH